MKNILNKILTIGSCALFSAPMLSSCATKTNILNIDSNNLTITAKNDEETVHQCCTVTYIGKKCTPNNCAIIARATDCSPKAVHLKLQHFKADELANKTLVGKLGFKYTMPEHTYAYTSCPLSEKTSDDPVWATGNWQNNGINEMGVGTSSTLTCSSNNKILALPNESFIQEGIGEEMFTQVITPQAATAKEAMQVAAKAIDDYGAQDANIIMSVDQNEAWLMEIYSRHQYCAVKLPDDKVCIAGNEFILDSLHDLGINATNKDDLCITSPNLFDLVKDTELVRYIAGTTEQEHDIFHLDLFNTYAREGTASTGTSENIFNDGCHMRTWRGYSLFDRSQKDKYDNTKKYAPFLVPKDENGNVRTDMTFKDVIEVYRDEFDEILDKENERYDEYFAGLEAIGSLRKIAVEQTRAVHILSSDPSKPKWMACNEWYTPDSGNYVPFLQFNNAVTTFDGDYGYYPERFNFDLNCSSVLFRLLNKLGWYDRTNYGMPLQDFWRVFEYIYFKQTEQVYQDISKLTSTDQAKDIANNFNKHVRDIYINQVKKTTSDLLWHIMDQPSTSPKFIPLIDLENYVKEIGWSNYKFDGTTATFERNSVKCTYTISDGVIYGKGVLKLNDGTEAKLRDSVVDNKVYVDLATLNSAIAKLSEVRTIDINDYLTKSSNNLVWILPTAIGGAAILIVGSILIIRWRKNKKAVKNPTTSGAII